MDQDEEAPDFDVETAFGELFTPNRTSTYNPRPVATKASWGAIVQMGNIALPPPSWWLAEQDTKGRQKSKFAIWNSRYSYGRKLSIWIMAPLEDFRRAKFLRKREEYS
jgi:hypothetical protein